MFGAHFFTFQAQETQGSPQAIPPNIVARLYCHAMVSALPDEALPDLAEELRDLETQFLEPPLAQGQLDLSTKLTAKLGKPVARPEFYVDGE